MVAHKSTFTPVVEHLENRNVPAAVSVTAAQLATLHDAAGFDGEVGTQANATPLPAAMANAVVVLQLPSQLNAFTAGYGHAVLTFESGDLVLVHWGIGADDAEAMAVAQGLAFLEPALAGPVPVLPASQELGDALLVMQMGEGIAGEALASGLQVAPAGLAATQPDGTLTLQLAIPLTSGWQVQSLISSDAGQTWTLADSAFTDTLTPTLGLWELTVH